jgi:hypothetical protein
MSKQDTDGDPSRGQISQRQKPGSDYPRPFYFRLKEAQIQVSTYTLPNHCSVVWKEWQWHPVCGHGQFSITLHLWNPVQSRWWNLLLRSIGDFQEAAQALSTWLSVTTRGQRHPVKAKAEYTCVYCCSPCKSGSLNIPFRIKKAKC